MRLQLNEPLLQGLGLVVITVFFFRKYINMFSYIVEKWFGSVFSYVLVVIVVLAFFLFVYWFKKRNNRYYTVFVLSPRKTGKSSGHAHRLRLEEDLSRISSKLGVEVKFTYVPRSDRVFIYVWSPDSHSLRVISSLINSYNDFYEIRITNRVDQEFLSLKEGVEKGSSLNRLDDGLFFGCDIKSVEPVKLSVEDVWRHIGVFGSTGSGKTTTVGILSRLLFRVKGIPVLIFDWHGEYEELLSGNREVCVLNPFSSGISVNPLGIGDLESVMNVFEDVFSLSPPQYSFLFRLLREKKIGSLQELFYLIDSFSTESFWDREVKYALIRKMEFLDSREGRLLFSSKNNSFIISKDCINIIDLSYIQSYRLRKLYALSLLREFYERVVIDSGFVLERAVIVLDEAHNVLPRDVENFLARMIAEVRKFGIAFIISTQSPSSINNEFLKNLNTKIIHSIRNSVDKTVILNSIPMDEEVEKKISGLMSGEAVFSSFTQPFPRIIKVCRELLYSDVDSCGECW